MEIVSSAYKRFRSEQLKTYDDNASIKETKEMLRQRLTSAIGDSPQRGKVIDF